jgi:hypothetical protein
MFLIIIELFYIFIELHEKFVDFYNNYFVFYSFTVLVLQSDVKINFLIWKEDCKTISV